MMVKSMRRSYSSHHLFKVVFNMNPSDLYQPDGISLTTCLVGAPGGGKSYFTKNTILDFMKEI